MFGSDEAIFLLKDSGDLEKVPFQQYDSEALLQTLIEKHPELLAGDQINPDEPVRFMLVKREAGVPDGTQQGDRWAIDHLLLDQNAIPTFVETKRSSDTRIRREIVGQMLDYAANAQHYWPSDRIRSMATAQYGTSDRVDTNIIRLLDLESSEDTMSIVEEYWSRVADNLHNGNVRLLFIADRLPAELRRVIEFLNAQMAKVEVLGIELAQYVGSDFQTLVPRLIGQTEAIRQVRQSGTAIRRRTNMQEFLDSCPEDLQDFFENAIAKAEEYGMQVYWGVKGFSLRAIENMEKPVTLFYGYPSGTAGKSTTYVQGYVANIDDIEYRNQVSERFLKIPGTTRSGDYTFNLDLNAETLEAANKLLQVAFDVGSELSQKALETDAQG